MAITLVTGIPGAGKTAKVVDMLAHDPEFQGRPLFVMGIPELSIDHQAVPPVAEWTEKRPDTADPSLLLDYFTFPPHSVIAIDEAQRVFRPRGAGSKVPAEVAAFETHRHLGIDFILLTQHANLLDANIRKLIGRHFHVHMHWAGRTLLEWPRCADPESRAERELAAKTSYKPPRRVFQLYKSAEAHTKIKRKVPGYVYLFGAAVVSAFGVGAYIYQSVSAKLGPAESGPVAKVDQNLQGPVGKPGAKAPQSAVEYAAAYQPRIAGLVHTAPVYDQVTAAKDAPWPAGCMATRKRCGCFDQQGNDYPTTDAVCRQIVDKGLFKPYGIQNQGLGVAAGRVEPGIVVPGSRRDDSVVTVADHQRLARFGFDHYGPNQ